ncbi:MAG TPA: GNAT family N-acetyltransferase [Ktedonobacterales bacterium]|nr:GNAT family N-acetyltransferase [Ktedonobacterales bacterium]
MSQAREPLTAAHTIERLDAADSDGLAAFLAIHEEAATWLWERGIRQWRPGEFSATALQGVLAGGGEVYLARRDGAPAGGFTLQWEDVEVWGERPPDAGYLHALCVRRADAGTGLSAALLDYASQRVATVGRAWLRLDCWAGNNALRAYYERQGFSLYAVVEEADYYIALYERAAGTARP